MREKENHQVIVFYFALTVVVVTAPWTLTHFVVPTPMEWLGLLGIGVLTQIAQICLTRALQEAEPALVTIFLNLGIVLSLLYGLVLFQESYPLAVILGMVIIMISVIGNALYQKHSLAKV